MLLGRGCVGTGSPAACAPQFHRDAQLWRCTRTGGAQEVIGKCLNCLVFPAGWPTRPGHIPALSVSLFSASGEAPGACQAHVSLLAAPTAFVPALPSALTPSRPLVGPSSVPACGKRGKPRSQMNGPCCPQECRAGSSVKGTGLQQPSLGNPFMDTCSQLEKRATFQLPPNFHDFKTPTQPLLCKSSLSTSQ